LSITRRLIRNGAVDIQPELPGPVKPSLSYANHCNLGTFHRDQIFLYGHFYGHIYTLFRLELGGGIEGSHLYGLGAMMGGLQWKIWWGAGLRKEISAVDDAGLKWGEILWKAMRESYDGDL
jgi:hypothetical protein